jgi:hypothetical protein
VIEKEGEEDEKGSYFLNLESPIEMHGQTFVSVKKERRVSQNFLAEDAEKYLKAKGLLKAAQTTVTPEPYTFLDQDKIYVLNQQGKLTDDELDSFFEDQVTWALKPIAG